MADTEFEDVIESIGGFGRFQKTLLWLYLAPVSLLVPGYFFGLIFMLSVPEHSCVLPSSVKTLNLTESKALHLRDLVVSSDNCYLSLSAFNASFIQDYLRHAEDENETTLALPDKRRVPCTQFTYDDTDYASTAGTKWDLVCDRDHLPSLVFTMSSVGCTVGTILFGILSDKIGRKYTFFALVLVAAVFGLSSIMATHFFAFIVLRAIHASIEPQMFQLPHIMLLELVGPSERTLVLGVVCIAWTLGLCLLPFVAYIARSWFTLGLIYSACATANLLYYKILPESPRWLLSQNRMSDAIVILKRIAKRNGVEPPENLASDLVKVQRELAQETEEETASSRDLFTKPEIRKNLIIITLCWVANNAAYYGLHINVTNMAGNEFLNFFLLAIIELPSYVVAWWTMERLGRRWSSVGFQLIVSGSCFASCLVEPDAHMLTTACFLIAKFANTASFMVMYQQAAEVMPTSLRSFALGTSSAISYALSISMPYVIFLAKYGMWIPFLVLGLLAGSGGVASAWLPETGGYPLCQTVGDVTELRKSQKFFSWNR
ncbi:carcinine transporter [Ixodes scapularis]|uniref:carcinine transporter n=1 Tax=Ixodes scapularis TaxID=6945 RepID=UPI001C388913|nr:carcinine transporter [Ixodes scapularis]